jgi:hypothetical protein
METEKRKQQKRDGARKSYLKYKVRRQLEAKKQRSEMRAYVQSLKTAPCTDCNTRYPFYVMDFDHRNESEKSGVISRIYQQGSWARLHEELAKCDLVCANCHRERTHQRLCRKNAVRHEEVS